MRQKERTQARFIIPRLSPSPYRTMILALALQPNPEEHKDSGGVTVIPLSHRRIHTRAALQQISSLSSCFREFFPTTATRLHRELCSRGIDRVHEPFSCPVSFALIAIDSGANFLHLRYFRIHDCPREFHGNFTGFRRLFKLFKLNSTLHFIIFASRNGNARAESR